MEELLMTPSLEDQAQGLDSESIRLKKTGDQIIFAQSHRQISLEMVGGHQELEANLYSFLHFGLYHDISFFRLEFLFFYFTPGVPFLQDIQGDFFRPQPYQLPLH